MIFLEADLSQIESCVILMLTRDPKCIAIANDADFDQHKDTAASVVFRCSEKDIDKPKRQVGKFVNHAAQRGMGGQKFSDELLKSGYVYTPEECQRWLDGYHARWGAIEGSYFPDIRKQVLRYRALVNTWGRVWRCDEERLDDELYRKAYSFLPQSEAADLMNQWGVKALWKALRNDNCGARMNATVHDSVLVSCHPTDAWGIAEFLKQSLERPLFYSGNVFNPRVEFKLGTSWAGTYEFKRLPSREEFTEKARACEAR